MIQKKRKVAILGTGYVGATIAYNLMVQGLFSEILLVDINKDKAEAEALDLSQCAADVPSCKIWSGEYADVAGSDFVIITFGLARKPDQTRLELAQTNINILKGVIGDVAKSAPEAMYIIVSNPVDLMTYTVLKNTDLSPNQIIGTGTLLDSNRLCQAVATYCNVDVSNVNAYVFGEHGEACMVPWSLCTIAGVPIRRYCQEVMGFKAEEIDAELASIHTGVVKAGSKVIKGKGATYYAIASAVGQLVKAVVSNTNTILPISTILKGEYGANDMCIGVPCVIGGTGVVKTIEYELTDAEKELFAQKIDAMGKTYDALGLRS